jgi:hypothetical protein
MVTWTSEQQAHGRKFMIGTGRAERRAHSVETELTLWGEWEPQAQCVETFATGEHGLPRRLWRPYYSVSEAPTDRLNTDPLVFGGFRYTICQQHRRYQDSPRPTRLRDLGIGSVILFGSRSRGEFVHDTVLVVASSWLHDASTYRRLAAPRPYFDVTLDTLYHPSQRRDCCKPSASGHEYRLYEGGTIGQPIEGMFSYVPCRPYQPKQDGFARPVIKHPLLSSAQSQGFRVPIAGDLSAIRAVWDNVEQQVLENPAGLYLGTWFEFPWPRRDTAGSPG